MFVIGTENPSTGYTWFIQEDTSYNPVFELISSSFISDPEDDDHPAPPGTPGAREFILRANASGLFVVHFVYV